MFKSLASESVDLAVEVLTSIRSQLKDASSNAAIGACVCLRGGLQLFVVYLWAAGVVCCSSFQSKSSESKRRLAPSKEDEEASKRSSAQLPPYPPSVRVLLRVQNCFQSLLIQSEVLSPSA